jgi:hypothetical protein
VIETGAKFSSPRMPASTSWSATSCALSAGTARIASRMFFSRDGGGQLAERLDGERRLPLAHLAAVGVEDGDEAETLLVEPAVAISARPKLPAPTRRTFHVLSVPRIRRTWPIRSSTR